MDENGIREALDRHWGASGAHDFQVEHDIYREDAVLEYPQSGERLSGRRIIETGDLWVAEFVIKYDGRRSYSVSVMEFLDGKAAHETQYFDDPFVPGHSRAHLVERMG